MILSTNLAIIIIAFIAAIAAIYILYSIIIYQGGGRSEELQLSTKNILEQVAILYDKQEYALVELLASKYLDRVPGHVEVRKYYAKACYEDRKYNLAMKQCDIVFKKKPYDVDTHLVLGKCYVKKQLYNKAIHEYEFVYDKNKTDRDVVETLAKLYRRTDQLYPAIELYGVLSDLAKSDAEIADIQSIIAELNEDAYDYPAAFEAYKTRLGIYPKDVETNKKLAELYIKINNYPVAIETLLYMLSFVSEPKTLLWIYDMLIDLYEVTEDYEKAIDYAEKILNVQGSDKFKMRDRIAGFHLKLNKVNEGILILEDLALMSQNGFDVTVELAQAYIKNKEYEKALERYLILLDKAVPKEAKKVNVLISELYVIWAVDKHDANQYEESLELLRNAAQYNTLNPEIYYNIALNNFDQKNYTGTVESVQKALEYDKDQTFHTKYLLLLAEAHHQIGNFFEEKKALTDLLNIDEKHPEGLYRVGLMYAAQHDIKNAEEAFKKAIQYDPDMIQAKYNLALLYENNNRDKAKELYMEVLDQDPTFIEAKNALTDISSGDSFF